MHLTGQYRLTRASSPLVAGACAAALALAVSPSAFAATSGTWSNTNGMHVALDGHTATLLTDGTVVVAGGEGSAGVTYATEVYNPITKLWIVSGNLRVARSAHNADLLNTGSVLVAGGCVGTCLRTDTATAELYNPATKAWTLTGSLHTARDNFAMATLPSGKVIAVGGCTAESANGCTSVTATAEIYDPATRVWTPTGSMHAARSFPTATVTWTGQVLVAGGANVAGDPLATAELYNPATGVWTATGAMKVARDEHTATALPNGKILVTGGENLAGLSDARSELYDPSTKVWTLTGSLMASRDEHTAVLLQNGSVLVSGGNNINSTTTTVLSSAELYNPVTGHWSTTGPMFSRRVGHISTRLLSGLVLNAGGNNGATELFSAETYTP